MNECKECMMKNIETVSCSRCKKDPVYKARIRKFERDFKKLSEDIEKAKKKGKK